MEFKIWQSKYRDGVLTPLNTFPKGVVNLNVSLEGIKEINEINKKRPSTNEPKNEVPNMRMCSLHIIVSCQCELEEGGWP